MLTTMHAFSCLGTVLRAVRAGLARRQGGCGRTFVCPLAGFLLLVPSVSIGTQPVRLNIVGGLSRVSQFTNLERPFWSTEIAIRSGGRLQATVHPYDESGFRGREMLQLMRLGVVPFGTALLAIAASDEPELNAVDLPAMNPDLPTLRRTVAAYRERMRTILHDRYRIELLGIYTYPAQVLFCTKAFSGLGDIAGRRVRTSSVGQSELVAALGGTPIVLPFDEMVKGMRDGVADCAITGTLSGNEIGLADVTTHIHAMAISWGLSIFGANEAALEALPSDLRRLLRTGVADLERRVWDLADRDTSLGLACNTGSPLCAADKRKTMTLVPTAKADEVRIRQLLETEILPRWVERCGSECASTWNALLATTTNVAAHDR